MEKVSTKYYFIYLEKWFLFMSQIQNFNLNSLSIRKETVFELSLSLKILFSEKLHLVLLN